MKKWTKANLVLVGVAVLLVVGLLIGYWMLRKNRQQEPVVENIPQQSEVKVQNETEGELVIRTLNNGRTSGEYTNSQGDKVAINAEDAWIQLTVGDAYYRGNWGWTDEGGLMATFTTKNDVDLANPVVVAFAKTAEGELTVTNLESTGLVISDLKFVAKD